MRSPISICAFEWAHAALKRQLDLEHVRVETENMEHRVKENEAGESLQATGANADGAEDREGGDRGEVDVGVSELLLSCNQV